jgi:hypothetical protein
MSRVARLHFTAALLLTAAAGLAFGSAPPGATADKAAPKAAPAYKLSGPFTHDNLTIFLIHGDDQLKGKKLLTLDEALQQKKVIVHETKTVNQLAIENVSAEDVFIQAGDIVKGGQQDRTIPNDQIVPAKSGRIPLAAFCVEAGRWSARGGEKAGSFSRSEHALVSNPLKLAARKANSQGEVWKNVAQAQMNLGGKLKADVRDAKSRSSLQLTLENKKLLEAVDGYTKKLQGSLARQADVIGYAVVINGKVSSADVYANADLFRRLWPKLLRGSAVEAVAERQDKKFTPATAAAVTAFLADPEKGKRSDKAINARLREVQRETDRNILFETCDDAGKGPVLRRSYLAK